jgi:hypothetical protein
LIRCDVGEKGGVVALKFEAPAEGVNVDLMGANGLVVTSDARPVTGGRFSANQRVELRVGYRAGPGMSHLLVAVEGRFASELMRWRGGCVVGGEDDAQRLEHRRGVKRDPTGILTYEPEESPTPKSAQPRDPDRSQ